ncbi:MAG TPA: TIGR03435 family protein, partial [Vicinamibacterales bacterium]|nr:TIGR03435 family protein [Vicinamibacterales bacterium]
MIQFVQRISGAALLLLVAIAPASGQPTVAFDVASIKLAAPLDPQKIMSGQMRIGMHVDPQRVEINSLALADLINIAFRVKSHQVVGPSWLTTGGMNADRFDIRATLPAGATTEQVPEMLQALLVERFKLEFHRDDRQQDVFALVVAKGGHKLKDAPPRDPSEPKTPDATPAGAPPMSGPVQISGNPQTGMTMKSGSTGTMKMSMGADGTMRMEMERMTLGGFADAITRFVDRPVINMTELKGEYTIALELSMADMMSAAKAMGAGIPGGAGAGPAGSPAAAAS